VVAVSLGFVRHPQALVSADQKPQNKAPSRRRYIKQHLKLATLYIHRTTSIFYN
jgi:hypothetical protein